MAMKQLQAIKPIHNLVYILVREWFRRITTHQRRRNNIIYFKKKMVVLFVKQPSATYTILLTLFVIQLSISTAEEPGNWQENRTFPALIAFGDSILDTGNNNVNNSTAKCNYPPYGIDFIGGKATGRFCDGKILTDFIGITI